MVERCCNHRTSAIEDAKHLVVDVDRARLLTRDDGVAWTLTYSTSTSLHFIRERVRAFPRHLAVHRLYSNPYTSIITTRLESVNTETTNTNLFQTVFSPVPSIPFLFPSLPSLSPLFYPSQSGPSNSAKRFGEALLAAPPAGENDIWIHQTRSPGSRYVRNTFAANQNTQTPPKTLLVVNDFGWSSLHFLKIKQRDAK